MMMDLGKLMATAVPDAAVVSVDVFVAGIRAYDAALPEPPMDSWRMLLIDTLKERDLPRHTEMERDGTLETWAERRVKNAAVRYYELMWDRVVLGVTQRDCEEGTNAVRARELAERGMLARL